MKYMMMVIAALMLSMSVNAQFVTANNEGGHIELPTLSESSTTVGVAQVPASNTFETSGTNETRTTYSNSVGNTVGSSVTTGNTTNYYSNTGNAIGSSTENESGTTTYQNNTGNVVGTSTTW